MDDGRFDTIAKSLAAWTSRRRLVAAAAGGAFASLVGPHQMRAQGSEPDPALLELIVELSSAAVPQLDPAKFMDQQFDSQRLPMFITKLRTLLDNASTNAGSWDSTQLQSFIDTITLIPPAISVGADTDAFLDQWVLYEAGEGATPAATPTVPAECLNQGHRPTTCSATCLEAWSNLEAQAEASKDLEQMVKLFFEFLDCYALFGTGPNVCLAGAAGKVCLATILCGCVGDCF